MEQALGSQAQARAPNGLWHGAPAHEPAAPCAHEALEREISQRRLELAQLRRSLQHKYDQLHAAEQVLRSTQSDMELAGRLALLGQMARNVIHELSQPLSEIRTFARNADAYAADGKAAKVTHTIARITDSSERMAGIIDQLKNFARKSCEASGVVNLQQALQDCAQLLQTEYSQAGVLLKVQAVDPVCAWGNGARVEQVLISLLRNALDAAQTASLRQVKVVLLRDGAQAVVKVRDSGTGLSDQALHHLFEPFFTTKPWGRGLGLGLAISASVAQAMHGTLDGHNHADGGAEFTLRLPSYTP